MRLQDANAIITGAASGLGKATAKYLTEAGAKVALLDIDENKGKEAAEELGPNAIFLKTNVSNPDEIEASVKEAAKWMGEIRLICTCAAIEGLGKVFSRKRGSYSREAWDRIIGINLSGTYHMIRSALPFMVDNEPMEDGEKGLIIMVSSCAGHEGQPGHVQYAATKGAVMSMTLPLARELSREGIRVMTISPGPFETPIFVDIRKEQRDATIADFPFPHRMGKPDEFARLVGEIAQNTMLNGCDIRLDGAMRLKHLG